MLRKFFFYPLFLFAAIYPPPPPEIIQQQLEEAEAQFWVAKQMFNPWYMGPLITSSANAVPPGDFLVQPYLYVIDVYGKYNTDRHSVEIPRFVQTNPVLVLSTGILKRWDIYISPQLIYNTQNSQSAVGFGDLGITSGVQLVAESPYNPAVKLQFSELFPTGRYKNLNPNKGGVDAIGLGSYVTSLSLNMSKVIWWIFTHPMSVRTSLNYRISSHVHVTGFNAYGGGYGTDGYVRPGQAFEGDFGYEYSFTQRWVFAFDLVYKYNGKTTFKGNPGITATGATATNTAPFSDQLSLAPALEYNPSGSVGVQGGVWFTVYGRSSNNFASAIISYYQLF